MPPVVRRVPGAALIALLAPVLAACDQGTPKAAPGGQPPPPQVTVAKPVARTVVEHDEYVGRFEAVDAVEVRARVSGYLAAIHFKDGQRVKKGELLFTIDRRPFQIALEQAKANLAQAKADLELATAQLGRAKRLVERNIVSRQTFDERTQASGVAEAKVAAEEAAVKQASLDLEFTELEAPISGHIGDRRVSVGNLVTGGTSGTTTLLATIQSIDPIRFTFTMDEGSYLRYSRLAKSGPDIANEGGKVPVKLKLLDEESFSHTGRMDFVDNAIDASSGTIRGRAVFDNPKGIFTPGMFGRLQVPAGPPMRAFLVPDAAISTEQVRKYVLVVDDQDVTRVRYVTLGRLIDGLRVVTSGLKADDRVVVGGLMRARPGVKVTPRMAPSPAAPERGTHPSH